MKTMCACGSERPYANCCERHHQRGEAPTDPVDLIRARYSAFAYRMPGYLMRTTDQQGPEYVRDAIKWEKELLQFCDQYKFKRLSGDVLGIEFEECTYSGPDVAYVQFRAYMLGPGQTPVEILERSKLTRYQGKWLYFTGTLVEWDGPLL
mmetsp:Transcript_37773/g.88304  ORF Transcript_37773/g.88304 Transcript_37773/m.88304 type:complete len:150 (-) Transcript_37773:174-623(-)